jgi:hypothetical protein
MSVPGFSAEMAMDKARGQYYICTSNGPSSDRLLPAIANFEACVDICQEGQTCFPLVGACRIKANICGWCKLWYRGDDRLNPAYGPKGI